MVGAGGRNNDVLASHFDIHIFGVCHKPMSEYNFQTRPEGKVQTTYF